jgi:hypothetical protein
MALLSEREWALTHLAEFLFTNFQNVPEKFV